jgi:hypothetical protein
MNKLEIIKTGIEIKFQYCENKIVEKVVNIFDKEFKKGNENLSFDELMRMPISDETNEEFDVPTVKEQLEFYIDKIIYDDIIEPKIRHVDDNQLLKILNQKGYGCLFSWKNAISEKYIEKIFNKIKENN